MSMSLRLAFLLAIPSLLLGAAGDVKVTQRNAADTGFVERTITASDRSALIFDETLELTTLALGSAAVEEASAFATAAQGILADAALQPADIGATVEPAFTFNVKTYGAAGDGAADDTAEIQAAIDAAEVAGGVVYFPPGTYIVSATRTLAGTPGVILRGAGPSSIVKSSSSTMGSIFEVTGSDVVIEQLTLDGAYTTGSHSGAFGLVKVTQGDRVTVRHCTLQNSRDAGVRTAGLTEDIAVEHCLFSNCFVGVVTGSTSDSQVPQRIKVTDCTFFNGWSDANETGAIKIQSVSATTLSAGHIVSGNFIKNPGEMGIEIFAGCGDVVAHGNVIEDVRFGISLDSTVRASVVGNSTRLTVWAGIEAAGPVHDVVIANNVVDGYTSGGARGSTNGIITSNSTPDRVTIQGNRVRGCTNGLQIQTSQNIVASGNQVSDCATLINVKGSSGLVIQGNLLAGPCSYHLFLDCFGSNLSDIRIAENTLTGAAADDNIIMFDDTGSLEIERLTLLRNDIGGATFGNLSANYQIPGSRLPYHFVESNYAVPGSGQASWPDGGRLDQLPTPFFRSDQGGGFPVAKKFTFTVNSSAGDQWFKIFSVDWGAPIAMPLNIEVDATADGKFSNVSVLVAASPFGQDSGILKFPDGYYQNALKEVIYNNLGGGVDQEIWLRFPATAGMTVTVRGSDWFDYWITEPSAVTSEPSWASNSTKLDFTTAHSELVAPGLKTTAPSGGASGNWRLGTYTAGAGPTADGYITIEIGGSVYRIPADLQ